MAFLLRIPVGEEVHSVEVGIKGTNLKYLRYIVAALLASLSTAVAAEPIPPDSAKIAEVAAGLLHKAFAHWWGFNPTDATAQLQCALDSRADTLVIADQGSPWYVTPLFMHHSNRVVIMEPGAVIQAKAGAFTAYNDVLWNIRDLSNITIIGYGATIRMRKKDYQNPPYIASEHRHAMQFAGCTECRLYGLRLVSSGGDGIYISSGYTGKNYCDGLLIQSCIVDSNNRQGMSVISARHLTIDSCIFSNTQGTAPQDGIDFEPNVNSEDLIDCTVSNSEFINNDYGIVVSLWTRTEQQKNRVSISLINNNSHNNRSGSMYFYGPFTGITGLGTTTLIANTFSPGIRYNPNPYLPLTVTNAKTLAMVAPAEYATDQPLTLVLQWQCSPCAQLYHLQLADNLTFQNPIVDDSTLTDTLRQVGPLKLNTQYYCHVSGKTESSWSSYSTVTMFTTVSSSPTNAIQDKPTGPRGYKLHQNFPNPFNPSTLIRFELPNPSKVQLKVFNMLGQEISTLVDGDQAQGVHEVVYNSTGVPSGVYLYSLRAQGFVAAKTMVLVK
jgi:hypothetical protein